MSPKRNAIFSAGMTLLVYTLLCWKWLPPFWFFLLMPPILYFGSMKSGGGLLLLDHYANHNGIRDRSTGQKMLHFTLSLFLCLIVDQLTFSLIMLGIMSFNALVLLGVKPRHWMGMLRIPLLFLLLGSLALLYDPKGNIVILFFKTSPMQRLFALNMMMRALACISCLFCLSLSTPLHAMLARAEKILPVALRELMYFLFQRLWRLQALLHQMQQSATMRGGMDNYTKTLRSMKYTGPTLFMRAMRDARAQQDALNMRGYEGKLTFFSELDKRKDPWLWGELLVILILCLTFRM